MSDPAQVIRGTSVPPEIKAEFDSLRAVFDTKSAMDRLDSYAKWLFGSAAIVGSLGAGLSNAAFQKLHGAGMWMFGLAVVAFGVCLIFASRSIAPQWVEVKLTELASLRRAVNEQFEKRQFVLTGASIFFAISLALAALAPLISILTASKEPIVRYSIDDKGNLDASLDVANSQPGMKVELWTENTGSKAILARTGTTIDVNGQAKLLLKVTNITAVPDGLDLVYCVNQPSETSCPRSHHLPIRRQ